MVYRLYIFTPPGSNQYGPYESVCGTLPNGCYNTGRFDDQSSSFRCTDARQFASLQDLLAYAAQNNEIPSEVRTIEEVNALCSATPSKQPPVLVAQPPPAGLPAPQPPATPVPTNQPGIPGSGEPPIINVTNEPPSTPEFTNGGTEDMQIYRLILESGPNRFDTGATYPGCSRATPNNCKPMQFAFLEEAVQFAKDHGEIPVKVNSEADIWDIVEGRKPVNEANVLTGLQMDGVLMAGAAVAALVVLPRLLGGRK